MAGIGDFITGGASVETAVFQRHGTIVGEIDAAGTIIPFDFEAIGKSFVSLASNQFTFEVGTYAIRLKFPRHLSTTGDPRILNIRMQDISGPTVLTSESLGGTEQFATGEKIYYNFEFELFWEFTAQTTVEIWGETNTLSGFFGDTVGVVSPEIKHTLTVSKIG